MDLKLTENDKVPLDKCTAQNEEENCEALFNPVRNQKIVQIPSSVTENNSKELIQGNSSRTINSAEAPENRACRQSTLKVKALLEGLGRQVR